MKPKGSGKSPLAAALSCCALAADVVFDGFDAAGEAVGRPHPSPHVQLAAVSQDQTDNTMSLVLSMLRDGEAADAIPGLDLGLTRVRTRNGKLEPVTASAPSREGQRLTDAILDEPHLWTNSNGGVRMAATLRRNLGKMNGRSLETTNAWTPGEESVAEQTAIYADKIASGDAVDLGLMRYHPQAQVRDLGLEAGDRIALGFDGSIRDDATVLIACRVEDRLFFPLGMWERPDGPAGEGWEVDREAVDEAVHAAFELYEPLAFFADVEHWESYIDAWTREYRERLLVKASPREPIAWDMRGRLQQSTLANERLVAAVVDGKIRHTGDVRLRRHVLNARRRPNRYGISFGKDRRGSRHKVDGWAGCLLADMAQHELEASGKNRTVDRRVVVFR
ncbi:terminase [Marinitenerispora sediminis]|uniref:Terminase n=1 Tax=Marinitenerispora sediminis TaxID=1931232 RepID=A0A368T6P7_9ACTN|nr:terminase [Marinitenerispora sediminis]